MHLLVANATYTGGWTVGTAEVPNAGVNITAWQFRNSTLTWDGEVTEVACVPIKSDVYFYADRFGY